MFAGIIERYRAHKERQENSFDTIFLPFNSHVIKPGVDQFGTPNYELRWVWFNGFSGGEKVIATNPDRAVLERAIKHLQSEDK